jgi:hypothetical protein
MTTEHFCNNTKADIIKEEHDHLWSEDEFEHKIEDEATTIRRYSLKKFVAVISSSGEHLLGYESPTMNIFYYRPGTMTFMAMHTSACDCNMCEWIYKPPSSKRTPQRHTPYQYGKRTPGNKAHPGTTSPPPRKQTPIKRESTDDWTNVPAEETRWDSLAEVCNWTEDPFQPTDEARDLDPKPATTTIKTAADWRKEHYETALRVTKMSQLRHKICPGIPVYNAHRGYAKAREACLRIKRAEQILHSAFHGLTSYRAAHQEWIFYLHKCDHGTVFHSPSQECYHCNIIEEELDQIYEDGWTHINNEGTV